jgi:transcriptional regulator with XRE-family HTH domain
MMFHEHLKKKKITPTQLARLVGVDRSTAWRWCNKIQVPIDKINAVSAATGIPREMIRPDIFGSAS